MMDGNIILSVAKAMEVLQILSQAEKSAVAEGAGRPGAAIRRAPCSAC